ncbi:hypothetical protein FB45DRAFT_919355 [Roridomyces roridus]|uniref:Peptidase M20 dimerisation domain-containing protein n=1 Tax=Roridomyces roridus TaxID=1738132 RepID=A0AAD7BRT9_9AGAR|nr:hypothetical protein FB45DRAFT_919355 [Roridomyces roridus]
MRGLPLHDAPSKPRSMTWSRAGIFLLASAAIFFYTKPILHDTVIHPVDISQPTGLPVSCPAQPPGLAPSLPFKIPSSKEPRRALYADRLRGAVRVRTETFDGAPTDGADPWYDKFYDFEAYLSETFPDVFGTLELEHVATHGLLLTWRGSEPDLKPMLLMAHQDVVPVNNETLSQWAHPPFDAVLDDDGWIWGRGAGDNKNMLIAHFSAVSELIRAGFTPTRTLLIALGFDEEGGAVRSASAIAAYLEDVYGQDGLFLIVDEGAGLMDDYFGQTWVTPEMAEKGVLNIQVSVNVPGGHSSIPPAHTAIGILSSLVTTIEAHPFSPTLDKGNPFAAFVMCLAEYGTIDPLLKTLLADERTWPAAAALMAERNAGDKSRLSTSQAATVVQGGVKVNALPEEAHVIVNLRVGVEDTLDQIYKRYERLLRPEAERFGLEVVGFGEEPSAGATRYLQLSSPFGAEASAVTAFNGSAWDLFARTSRHLFPTALVAPYLATGGTDSRAYTARNLTKEVFRFQAARDWQRVNIHTVDERVLLDGHLNTIAWLHAFIQNVDAFRG